jgi:hypothetical protein
VQQWQADVREDEAFASALAAAHAEYGATRWQTLTEEDRAYCESHGYAAVLRDTGVGGLRFVSQIKCLHAHLAHALAGGANPVGQRVLEALARNEDGLSKVPTCVQ